MTRWASRLPDGKATVQKQYKLTTISVMYPQSIAWRFHPEAEKIG